MTVLGSKIIVGMAHLEEAEASDVITIGGQTLRNSRELQI